MNPSKLMIGLVPLLMLVGIGNAAWSFQQGYPNSINITAITNTLYNPAYVGASAAVAYNSLGGNVNWVLVNLSVPNPQNFHIEGYDGQLNDLGRIPFYVVSTSNTASLILVNRLAYSTFKVPLVFNPTSVNWTQATISYGCVTCNSTIINFPVPTQVTYNGVTIKVFAQQALINLTLPSPYYPQSAYAFADFILNQSSKLGSSMVIYANRSIANVVNITYDSPYSDERYYLNGTGTIYKLQSPGFCLYACNYVSSGGYTSNTYNSMFGTNGDGKGFDAYITTNPSFSIQCSTFISEGMERWCPNLFGTLTNSITQTGVGTYFAQSGDVKFNINTATPTTVYIMPAFTTAFTMNTANVAVNPSGTQIQTTSRNYKYGIAISNIKFIANLSSTGCGSPGCGLAWHNYSNIGYAMFNVTHYSEMGTRCENLTIKSNSSTQFFGFANYYVWNYTNAHYNSTGSLILGKCNIIASNLTSMGLAYNSLYLLYGNPLNNGFGAGSNVITYTNWQFNDGQLFYTSPQNYNAYVLKMNNPVNIGTNLTLIAGAHGNIWLSYNTVSQKEQLNLRSNCGASTQEVSSTVLNQNWLIDGYGGFGQGVDLIAGLNPDIQNSTSTITQGGGCLGNIQQYGVYNSINSGAVDRYLYSSYYTFGASYILANYTNINLNATNPSTNASVTIGTTKNQSGFLAIPLFNFNQSALKGSVSYLGWSVPKYALSIVSLILLAIAALVFNHKTKTEQGIVFVILFMWITGLWVIQIEILAVFLSILFMAFEFIDSRRTQIRATASSSE